MAYFGLPTLPKAPVWKAPAQTRYATTPAPLSSELLRALDARKIAANQQLGTTLAQTSREQQLTGQNRLLALRAAAREGRDARFDVSNTMGGMGQALNPAAMGRAVNAVAEQQGEMEAAAKRAAANRLAELTAMRAEAYRQQQAELAEVERQRAYAGANLDLLLPGVNF